ncbi:LamG domain-containing protein [Streptomyces fradiae]|uniref:LamG domain-containing protein n=1 Tax=Streptomyces fradiae TaxID=1906 RepID=UPI0033CACAE3
MGKVAAQFEAWWTDAQGVEQRRSFTTPRLASGSRHTWRTADDIPDGTVVSWRVRAVEGAAVSPWSDAGQGAPCEFVLDEVSPEKPVVTSTDAPGEQYTGSVGEYAKFTADSPSDDVVAYRYTFLGGTTLTEHPAEPGGPVTLRHLPLRSGPDRLEVTAVDPSGRTSAVATYDFMVDEGRPAVAHWSLADPAGSTTAAALAGTAAQAGPGVTFGAEAPRGTSLTTVAGFDGTSGSHLSPGAPAVGTGGTYAVSAWARPSRTDADMTIASQDAGSAPGFALGLRTQEAGAVWSFAVGGATVSGGAPRTGEWAHLLGIYDAETGRARLYVNGREAGTETEAAPVSSAGAFQIGRARNSDGYRDHWHGRIGDVRVHDRVVVPAEAAELAHRAATSLGRWSMETSTDGVSPERNGGQPLTLGSGATIHRGPDGSCIPDIDPDCPDVPYALVGDGHLQLDGANGHATTGTTVVETEDSFSVSAFARLADSAPEHPMTVLSQAGVHTDVFKVRYDPAAHAWQLVMALRDEPNAPEQVVHQSAMPHGGTGPADHLAVVYDDDADLITLYVGGQKAMTATLPEGLRSTGALQIGRAKSGDGWGEYFRGDVDEVRAFVGALTPSEVQKLALPVD